MKRTLRFAVAVWLTLSVSSSAEAALTVSEQAQIRSFVAEARVASAIRVRAMVARPDLSIDESSAALRDALAPVPFNEARATYLREMLFGPASAPSRSVMSVAITRAVLSRADAVLTRSAGGLEAEPQALAELGRIYAFVDTEIANAGKVGAAASGGSTSAHDPAAGIPASSYEDCAKALAEHVARHPRVLRGDATIAPEVVPARAQAQLALLDMMNDTPTRRVDAADRLALVGPRRALLTELGLLLVDGGQAEAAKVDRVRAVLSRLPAARADVEALYFGDAKPALKGRGAIVGIKSSLDGAREGAPPPAIFGDEVDGAAEDAMSVDLARELATRAVKRALDVRPELRAQATRDWQAAGGDAKKLLGVPADGSLEAALAAAAQLLVLDAPRAIDLAMVRTLGGRPEAAAILSDALGALAAYAPATSTPSGLAVPVGRPKPGGTSETVLATNLRLASAGYVTSFTLLGHTWTLGRDDAGPVTVKRDGAPLTLAMIPGAHVPVAEGAVWSSGGLVFARMQGAPRAGIAPGPRLRLVGAGPRGFDAIATAAPGDDVVVEADVSASGEVAIAVRAIAGREAWKAIALVLVPGASATAPWRASIRATDDLGKEAELAAPVDVPAAPVIHAKLVVKGSKLDVTLGGVTLKATVPAAFAHGDVALGARKGAALEVAGWSVRRP